MTNTTEDIYEIRLRLDTTSSWLEAVDIAKRLETQINKFADHSNTAIDWHNRVVEVLGAPHLILRAPAEFISKIEHFPEVVSVELAQYATRPRADTDGQQLNDNQPPAASVKKSMPKPPKL